MASHHSPVLAYSVLADKAGLSRGVPAGAGASADACNSPRLKYIHCLHFLYKCVHMATHASQGSRPCM